MFKNIFTFFSKNKSEDESLLCETESFSSSDSVSQSSDSSEIHRIVRNTTDYDDPPSTIDVVVTEITETDRIVIELINMYVYYTGVSQTTPFLRSPLPIDIGENLVSMYNTYNTYKKILGDSYQSFIEFKKGMYTLSRHEMIGIVRTCFPDCTFTDTVLGLQYNKFMCSVNMYYQPIKGEMFFDLLYNFDKEIDKHFDECKIYLKENNEALDKEMLKLLPPFSDAEYTRLRTLYVVGDTVLFPKPNATELTRLHKIIALSEKHPINVDIHKKRLDEMNAQYNEVSTIREYITKTLNDKRSGNYQSAQRINELKTEIYRNTRSDKRIEELWKRWFKSQKI
jgi:hypothetical protein